MKAALTNWRWWLGGLAVALVLVEIWLNFRPDETPRKVVTFTALSGEKISYTDQRVLWNTGQPPAFVVIIPVDKQASQEDIAPLADTTFAQFAGPRAADMGFRRVVIRPDDDEAPSGIDLFGLRFSIFVSAGPGPADLNLGKEAFSYVERPDGVWAHDESAPDAPPQLGRYVLPSGAVFESTGFYLHYPFGEYVYDCLSCTATNASQLVADNLYPLLRAAFEQQANADGMRKAEVAIFLGPRKSGWSFPTIFRIRLVKRSDGQWIGPRLTPSQTRRFLDDYRASMLKRGDELRKRLDAG